MNPDSLAIVHLPAERQHRAAAFVWEIPGGMAWLEPHYRGTDANTQPQFHTRAGTIVLEAPRARLVDPEGGTLALIGPMGDRELDDPEGTCTLALMDFTDALVRDGVTLEEERASVEGELGDELQ